MFGVIFDSNKGGVLGLFGIKFGVLGLGYNWNCEYNLTIGFFFGKDEIRKKDFIKHILFNCKKNQYETD